MASLRNPPSTIGEIIDYVERIREELLMVQNALEKMESAEPALSDGKES